MSMFVFPDTTLFQYLILPLLIIAARIIDVTIGTIRIIYVSKGLRFLAPILGFFEVFVWITVVGQVITQADNLITYIAYALGFALGTYVGMFIENKISMGYVIVRLITRKEPESLIETLLGENVKFTKVSSDGSDGRSQVLLVVCKRKRLPAILSYIKQFNPKAFFSVEDLRLVSDSSDRAPVVPFSHVFKKPYLRLFNAGLRKSK